MANVDWSGSCRQAYEGAICNIEAIDDNSTEEVALRAQGNTYPDSYAATINYYAMLGIRPVGLGVGRIDDMNDWCDAQDQVEGLSGGRANGAALLVPFGKIHRAMNRDAKKGFAVEGEQIAVGRFPRRRCSFQHRVEHRLEVAGRGIDDAEHLGGSGLLSARFVELGGARDDLPLEFRNGLMGGGHRVIDRCDQLLSDLAVPPLTHLITICGMDPPDREGRYSDGRP